MGAEALLEAGLEAAFAAGAALGAAALAAADFTGAFAAGAALALAGLAGGAFLAGALATAFGALAGAVAVASGSATVGALLVGFNRWNRLGDTDDLSGSGGCAGCFRLTQIH